MTLTNLIIVSRISSQSSDQKTASHCQGNGEYHDQTLGYEVRGVAGKHLHKLKVKEIVKHLHKLKVK